jgi:predicted lipoprotein
MTKAPVLLRLRNGIGHLLDIPMRPMHATAGLLLIMLSLSACKIVKTETVTTEEGQATAGLDKIAQLAEDSFAAKLLPLIDTTALDIAALRSAIAADLAGTGAKHGNRGAGQGAAWNFAVKGEGVVVSANLTSRARKAELDTDGDGAADMTLLLGPVIAGTTLRDVAPFYDFGAFKDQIEFAQLARALNDKASPALVLPEGDLTGKRLSFKGALALKSAKDALVVTAVNVAVLP